MGQQRQQRLVSRDTHIQAGPKDHNYYVLNNEKASDQDEAQSKVGFDEAQVL